MTDVYEINRGREGENDTWQIVETATRKHIANVHFWGDEDRPQEAADAYVIAEFLAFEPEMLRAWRKLQRKNARKFNRSLASSRNPINHR
jgi:hypothetical protein